MNAPTSKTIKALPKFTGFEVTYNDGTSYQTSTAPTTLAEFTIYITQDDHTDENPATGTETRRTVTGVRGLRDDDTPRKPTNDREALRELIQRLQNAGHTIPSLFDSEAHIHTKHKTIDQIVNLVFEYDEVWMKVKTAKSTHTIYLIPNNGEMIDMICDWSFDEDDADGFNKLMDEFLEFIDTD